MRTLNKPQKIRSKKIRESARGERCTLRVPGVCNGNRETTVFCHINSASKGAGTKSHDIHGFYGCYACHMHHEAGKVSAEDELRAL